MDSDVNPIIHFLEVGVHKGFNPNPNFDTNFYCNRYPDIYEKNINPFVHYIKYGLDEHRLTKFLSIEEIFNMNFSNIQDVEDYLIILNSNLFDSEYYCEKYGLDSDVNPIIHFLEVGVHKGFNPNPNFDTNYYLSQNPNIQNFNINPFIFYLKYDSSNVLTKNFSIDEILSQNLKLCLKGKDNYLFLINDENNEIRQHFDFTYENKFNKSHFLEEYYFKKELFEDNGIEYFFFCIPDKSIVCKDFLPFHFDKIKRNVDSVKEIIDFKDYLNHLHYFKFDTHINYFGGHVLSFKFLNHMDKKLTMGAWNNLLDTNVKEINEFWDSDLLSDKNWSYSKKEQLELKNIPTEKFNLVLKPLVLSSIPIPDKFKFYHKRESFHWYNPYSFSDKSVLIFRDSTFDLLKWYFSFYYRDIFLCWDHATVDENLIKFINPDVIIEARVERFIDNLATPDWVKNKKIYFWSNINIFGDSL
ncbi:hypothetical protein [Methanobrevibacter millerae]|uniref:hypothetical protein n=1 Tax=Methanobrevibacter millerae TaxID=230361 RepID=UPI0012ECCB7F|nr:hypothetical protein [Methanobrevibacter millerae]